MNNFWGKFRTKSITSGRAFTVLAPMEDVTDTVFRQLMVEQGRPDILMTEFTNCDGLASRGREHVIHRLAFTPNQHIIVAQIWGKNLETYVKAVPLLIEMGFDGIDINMGCPVSKVVANGAGSGLIKNPTLASEIIHAVREGIQSSHRRNVGLSVKTRIGFNTVQPEWVEHLLSQPIDALTLHLRTRKEMSKVPAHWEHMNEYVAMRDQINSTISLIGNGDITTKEQLATYREAYGIDGLMVGRGIFDNMWLFNPDKDGSTASKKERIALIMQHIELFIKTWGKSKNFEMIKKYFKIYLKNFDGAAQLRNDLITLRSPEEMLEVLKTVG
ncbi:tRNA-dihydrouridine synthase [bacterium]|nr:tRNA-dihydrouridine synthase [bacterium]